MAVVLAHAQSAGPVVGFQKLRLSAGQHDLDPRLSAFALDRGTISGVANGRLLCATGRWETNRWANHQVLITTGTGAGLLYTIQNNTENQMQATPDPLADNVVLVGAGFEIVPNLDDDFGAQLAAGDAVAAVGDRGQTNAQQMAWKDAGGTWRDADGNLTTVPLLPGQPHQVVPSEERQVVITGRVLWPSEDENTVP